MSLLIDATSSGWQGGALDYGTPTSRAINSVSSGWQGGALDYTPSVIYVDAIEVPAGPGYDTFILRPKSSVARGGSGFSLNRKTQSYDGCSWEADLRLPALSTEQAREWRAFFHRLNGTQDPFKLYPAVGGATTGTLPSTEFTLTVLTDRPEGSDLQSQGWPVSTSGLLVAGSWISIAPRLYMLLEDVDSDSMGLATLTVWPKLRGDVPTATPILTGSAAFGEFRLLGAFPEEVFDMEHLVSSPTSFTVVESSRNQTRDILIDARSGGWRGGSLDYTLGREALFEAVNTGWVGNDDPDN